MKNSRVLYIFLLVLNFCGTSGGVQLDEFLKAVDDAHSELQWLDGISADGTQLRKRSASIGELLARFDLDDDDHELEDGDAWYQSFRAKECQHGGCQKNPSKKTQFDDYNKYYDEAVDVKRFKNLNDQREETANDLSHEANYKLSKIEQDAAEKSLPNRAWPINHRNNKRRLDPMDAVKLKTRLGMLKNYDGRSIPSADGDEITVEDTSSNQKGGNRVDLWKRNEGRRLLSVDEDGEDPVDGVDPLRDGYERREELLSVEHPEHEDDSTLDLQQFDNLKQERSHSRELGGRLFDDTQVGNQQYGNDLMRTDAFVKLQKYLEENQDNKIMSSAQKPPTVPPKDHDINTKQQMSANTTVLGEGKQPEEFHRSDPITTVAPTSSTNEEIGKSVIESSENFPLNEIITGKLTSQLMKTVFDLVKTCPSLNVLLPSLMRNKAPSPSEVRNFDAIRTQENESEMQRAETMFRQAMNAINAIIEQQVRSRSCVPLPSDLQAFYNLIIQSQAQNERESTSNPPSDMSDTEIRKKSKIIQKLLRDYEELPREDQDQVVRVKRNLLVAAEQLGELQQQSKRRKGQIMQSHFNDKHTSSVVEKRLSPEFVKLSKTAEMLLHNSFKTPDFSYL